MAGKNAGDWTPIREDLYQHEVVHRLAAATGVDVDGIVGKLGRFWLWAGKRTITGALPGVSVLVVNRVVSCALFGETLLICGWLKKVRGGLVIVRWKKHNDKCRRKRDFERERKRRQRGKCPTYVPVGQSRDSNGTVTVREVRGGEVEVRGENPPLNPRGEGEARDPLRNGHTPAPLKIAPGADTSHPHQHRDRAICERILQSVRWPRAGGGVERDKISRKQLGRLLDSPGCVPVRVFMLSERIKRGDGKGNPATWIEAGIDQAWACNGEDEAEYGKWFRANGFGLSEALKASRA